VSLHSVQLCRATDSSITFYKYQATGNDFIFLISEDTFEDQQIQKLCHRRFGIGADGVIVISKSVSCDVRMRIFNRDGSAAESCGNALLCLAKLLKEYFIETKEEYSIELPRQTVSIMYRDGQSSISFPKPSKVKLQQSFVYQQKHHTFHYVDTGVPHIVIFSQDSDLQKVLHEHYRVNVNRVHMQTDPFVLHTYERGVGWTYGCGTGTVAAAVALSLVHDISSPVTFQSQGGKLIVSFTNMEHAIANIRLTGTAYAVFSGSYAFDQ
jgi:diaminopimelate epimerase